jgi:sugar phosphate isomerase/epimerase
MTRFTGNYDDFGMDTISLAGQLEAKLRAIREGGFTQVMLSARDLVSHPGSVAAACRAVRASGLRVTGFQVLRDFEALTGRLHEYKMDVARSMLDLCAELESGTLLVCSSTLSHAANDRDHIARDLHKLAMLAVPCGIRIAYEALSWGRNINDLRAAWDVVCRADAPNLGLAVDSFHCLATRMPLHDLDTVDARRIFLVQLSDFMWREVQSSEERIETARHFRVFPGEGVHTAEVADMVRHLVAGGYGGDFSFEVFNDDYVQLRPSFVVARARRAAEWLGEEVLQRPVPLPSELPRAVPAWPARTSIERNS